MSIKQQIIDACEGKRFTREELVVIIKQVINSNCSKLLNITFNISSVNSNVDSIIVEAVSLSSGESYNIYIDKF